MGNSGFYLNDQQNCVFADNIKVGQMTVPLQDKQIVIGTTSTPRAATFSASDGLKIEVNEPSTGQQVGDINISIDKDTISDIITDDVQQEIVDKIVDSLKDQIIKDILDQITQNPAQALSPAFKSIEINQKIQCEGLFTKENVNTLLSGTEICTFNFTPKSTTSSILVTASIFASRVEGNVVMALVKEGDNAPCAISYNYSSGAPNLCQLRAVVPNTSGTAVKFSLRVGGLNSGVVWVNALPNGDNILGITTKSIITCMELNQTE